MGRKWKTQPGEGCVQKTLAYVFSMAVLMGK